MLHKKLWKLCRSIWPVSDNAWNISCQPGVTYIQSRTSAVMSPGPSPELSSSELAWKVEKLCSKMKFITNLNRLIYKMNSTKFYVGKALCTKPRVTTAFTKACVTKLSFSLYDNLSLSLVIKILTQGICSKCVVTIITTYNKIKNKRKWNTIIRVL
jgi:hypothetical protein